MRLTVQQWDEALAIDDQHVPALLGRAYQQLNAGTPDIEGAFADIGLAEQVDFDRLRRSKPAKALAHAKRAASLATDGKIADAEKDLKEAETLGALDSQLTSVRQLLAVAYVKQAASLATDGKIVDAEKDLKEAETLGALDTQLTSVRQLLAVAYVKQAASLATDGKIVDAEKDLKEAETLGALDTQLTPVRQVLAVAYVKQAEDAVQSGNASQVLASASRAVEYDESIVIPPAVLQVLSASQLSQLPPSVLSQLPPHKNTIGMEFKLLPGGTFTMGDAIGDDDETPHQVTLTKAFELGVYEVTQEQYEAVMGRAPSKFKGPQNPVETVSWDDAVEFCRKLSELPAEKKAGYVYRLPTEAEWEYACRAGTTTTYSFGDSDSELGDYAWYDKNSGNTTHPVRQKKPNAWGLYDLHGNVWEWCQDWHGDYPSGSGSRLTAVRSLTDPTGAARGSDRVSRGGSWYDYARDSRSANRSRSTPDYRNFNLGFRVVRSSIKKSQHLSQPVGQTPAPAVAPFDMAQTKAHQKSWADHLAITVETANSIGMKFAVIPPGEFMMGSPEDEPGRQDDETLHKVTLTKAFELGVYEVTQEQYEAVMGRAPSKFKGPQNPVETVSWDDAVEFCRKLSELPEEKAAGYVYRLPTEAEWEYACRAGTTTDYSFGGRELVVQYYGQLRELEKLIAMLRVVKLRVASRPLKLTKNQTKNILALLESRERQQQELVGKMPEWFAENSGDTTHPVGGKKPNPWGLYDMHGNVCEWCQDWYGDYPSGSVTDPTGAASGSLRVHRGGSWIILFVHCRSAFRGRLTPDIRYSHLGFRVLRSSIK